MEFNGTKNVPDFDSKIFKLGKTPRKSAASTTPGAATATTPESMAESDYEEEEEVCTPLPLP